MTFYKIIVDHAVIDVGDMFLKWNEKHRILMACDIKEAQYAQSCGRVEIYHDSWLLPPTGNVPYTSAEIQVIDQEEYEQLRALLDDGEPIPQPEEVLPEPEEETAEEPIELPMSIREMRALITEQQDTIEELKQQIQTILQSI